MFSPPSAIRGKGTRGKQTPRMPRTGGFSCERGFAPRSLLLQFIGPKGGSDQAQTESTRDG